MSFRPKIFSLEEANALLPEVEVLVTRLRKKKAANERLHDELFMEELLNEAVKKNPGDSSPGMEDGARQLDHSVSGLADDIQALRTLGCIVRNLDRGWVEFFGRHQGIEVYYCWSCGEKTVQYYRLAQATFSQRLPIS